MSPSPFAGSETGGQHSSLSATRLLQCAKLTTSDVTAVLEIHQIILAPNLPSVRKAADRYLAGCLRFNSQRLAASSDRAIYIIDSQCESYEVKRNTPLLAAGKLPDAQILFFSFLFIQFGEGFLVSKRNMTIDHAVVQVVDLGSGGEVAEQLSEIDDPPDHEPDHGD